MAEWRFYAQRLLTNEWLDRDLVLRDVNLDWALSGAGSLTATLDAVLARQIASDGFLLIDEWSTAIYAETQGEIRWGGIVQHSNSKDNGEREFTAVGFSGYPHGRIYEGMLADPPGHKEYYAADPFDIVRMLWAEAQFDPRGDIGVVVDDTVSGTFIGDPPRGNRPQRSDYSTNKEYQDAVTAWQATTPSPYQLAWWNTPDIGGEIDNVMSAVKADYSEEHSWADEEHTVVEHRIHLAWPQMGTRRLDLRFAEGENIMVEPVVTRDGEKYANQLLALGIGEDRSTLVSYAGTADEPRVRRDAVYTDKRIRNPQTLREIAERESIRVRNLVYFDTIEVFDHPHAPIGSWELGDEILVTTFTGFEELTRWVRIVGYTMAVDDTDKVTLRVEYSTIAGGLVAGLDPSDVRAALDLPGDFYIPEGTNDPYDIPTGPPEPPPDPSPSAKTTTLRVATFNVGPGRQNTQEHLDDFNKIAPFADVIGCQEAGRKTEAIRRFLDSNKDWDVWGGTDENVREETILYRKNIGTVTVKAAKLAVGRTYLGPNGSHPVTMPPKYIKRLEIDEHATGRHLVFTDCHMAPSIRATPDKIGQAEYKRRQDHAKKEMSALCDVIDAREGFLFVTGDFNATPENDLMAPLFDRVHIDHNYDTLNNLRVDFVCHRPHDGIAVTDTKHIGNLNSDHDCAIVTYKLTGAP